MILPTSVVQVQGKRGVFSLRAPIDFDSQMFFITDVASQKISYRNNATQ